MFHINGVIQNVVFCDWHFLLNDIIFSRFIHVVSYINTLFLFVTNSSLCRYTTFCYGHLECFHFLAIMNNACMNISVQICVWMYAFNSLGYTPRSGIAGSHGDSMFNFLRNCQTASQSSCTSSRSHQQCMRVLISPHSHQHLLLGMKQGFDLQFPKD